MIPFIDLNAQRQRIKGEIDAAIARVLNHGKFIMGPEVDEFESDLADFVGAKHCIGVSNGTDALSASLMALNVGPGNAVLTTPFTFFATIEAIMLRGATPVFVDIDPETFNICPQKIPRVIERIKSETDLNPRGIVPVDLFGLPADYQAINQIAAENGMFVLQDSAQACGAKRFGIRAPAHGTVGTVSFFPAKPLGCYGDGGAILTDDDQIADLARSIRMHGKGLDKYDNVRIGLNARLDTIQAAILSAKLKIYPDELALRQRVATAYRCRFVDVIEKYPELKLSLQTIPAGAESVWAQFVIRTPFRNQISEQLKNAGIPTLVYYRTPAHQLKACAKLPIRDGLNEAETLATEVLALPFYPYLPFHVVDQVCDLIQEFASKNRQLTV